MLQRLFFLFVDLAHVVDLDGARLGHIVNYRTLEHIASRTSLIIDFGGGIKEDGDLEIAFDSGARMITGGSIAVTEPEKFAKWIQKYGSKKIILGADCNNKKIAIHDFLRRQQLQRVAAGQSIRQDKSSAGIERPSVQ